MTTTTPESRGQIAYTAYGRALHFRTSQGEDIPTWNALLPADRAAWVSAANTIWDIATTGHAVL